MTPLQLRLAAMGDSAYAAFQKKLIPNIPGDTVLGVRAPVLRKLAAEGNFDDCMHQLPHRYLEENILHGYLINRIQDVNLTIEELERFLPFVDNWAVCDGIRPRCVAANQETFLPILRRWLCDSHPYTVRFAMEMLMVHYLEDAFDPVYLQWVSEVVSNEYYVNMMAAWYFATALAKQYEAALPYLENRVLSTQVHKKTVQKAVESFRITPEQKMYLRSLR